MRQSTKPFILKNQEKKTLKFIGFLDTQVKNRKESF